MTYDLRSFALSDMSRCGVALRKIGGQARSMEEVANRIVNHFRTELVDGSVGVRCCPLVRSYITQRYDALDEDQQGFASVALEGNSPTDGMRFLALLATAGEEPAWNSRQQSAGHRVIPLASREIVARTPMIASLLAQFGVDIGALLAPEPLLLAEAEQKTYNVFYVPEALGSPSIPAQQQFVVPYRIRSVLGFGGVLPTGDLFAVILFSRVPIGSETAALFKTLALNVKLAILPFVDTRIFA